MYLDMVINLKIVKELVNNFKKEDILITFRMLKQTYEMVCVSFSFFRYLKILFYQYTCMYNIMPNNVIEWNNFPRYYFHLYHDNL